MQAQADITQGVKIIVYGNRISRKPMDMSLKNCNFAAEMKWECPYRALHFSAYY